MENDAPFCVVAPALATIFCKTGPLSVMAVRRICIGDRNRGDWRDMAEIGFWLKLIGLNPPAKAVLVLLKGTGERARCAAKLEVLALCNPFFCVLTGVVLTF